MELNDKKIKKGFKWKDLFDLKIFLTIFFIYVILNLLALKYVLKGVIDFKQNAIALLMVSAVGYIIGIIDKIMFKDSNKD